MSTPMVSRPANQGSTARRRAVDVNSFTAGSELPTAAAVIAGEKIDSRLTASGEPAPISGDASRNPVQSQGRTRGHSRKSTKPRWLTVVKFFIKNLGLLVVLLGFVQMIRLVVLKSGPDAKDFSVISGDYEGKLFEMEKFVKTTVKAMQVQVDAVDNKLEDEVSSVRKEFGDKLKKNVEEIDLKLKALDARSDALEKFMDGFRSKSLLSKEEFGEFFEEFMKVRKDGGADGEISLDEIRDYARQIVEKELEKHAADGLGMVDYALASGGGRVLRHSEPYVAGKVGGSGLWYSTRTKNSAEAEKMINPSFGEPGQCFPLKGASGFAVISLRTAIIPEAVTLEHVAKAVAYDRSSAPKHCRVYGWLQDQNSPDLEISTENLNLLTEFDYDLEKSHIQTFKVEAVSSLINTVRLDFTSNHGSSFTCIYRLRVHGHEPSSVPTLEMQS